MQCSAVTVRLISLIIIIHLPASHPRNTTDSAELVTNYELSLTLPDIMPLRMKHYDKNRAPKLLGQPTVVYFHVTVLSLDSINEVSNTTLPR